MIREIEALNKLKAILRDKGIKVDDFAVIGLTLSDQLIGERLAPPTLSDEKKLTGLVRLRNPKRYFRLQQMSSEGLTIQFLIGDLDMMDAGVIQVESAMGYLVEDMSVEGQTALLTLYLDFLERKQMNRAREAGLHLPTRNGLR